MSQQLFQKAVRLAESGQTAPALAQVRALLAKDPRHVGALELCSVLLLRDRRFAEALPPLRRAVELRPKLANLRLNLAQALFESGAASEASEHYEKAVGLDPFQQEAWRGLILARSEAGRLLDALDAARETLRRWPAWSEIAGLQARQLLLCGQVDEARAFLEEWLGRHPQDQAMRAMFAGLSNMWVTTPEETLAIHRAYGAGIAARPQPPMRRARSTDRPWRLGFLSGDLRTHSVGYFAEALFTQRPDDFEIEVFSTLALPRPDSREAFFRERSTQWHAAQQLSDQALDSLIRSREIDLLLDLGGHTEYGRLPALARKPAPLLVTALGYAASTGLPAMDFRLVDSLTDPPDAPPATTERLLRLDPCFLCYAPPPSAPEPSWPTDEPFAFGSFNNLAKLGPATLQLWRVALQAVPGSILRVKFLAHDWPAAAAHFWRRIDAAGLDRTRLELLPMARSFDEHLAQYARVHVALDSYPYHGTTTTCEALWMGAPVLTLAGAVHAARVGVSLLHAVGHPEWVARDEAEFARLARSLAGDRPRLAALRQSLRGEVAASVLTEAKSYAARFYGQLRGLLEAEA